MAFVPAGNQDSGNRLRALRSRMPEDAGAPTLGAQLRTGTAALHEHIENLLRLPHAIRTRDEYSELLGHFLGFYEPLGALLSDASKTHPSCSERPELPPADHAARLDADLAVLGADAWRLPRAVSAQLPSLPSFAHVVGAHYVLEGAALGGRIILRDIGMRIGGQIAGATQFFEGRARNMGFGWTEFRAAIDDFGAEQPQSRAGALAGAKGTFQAMIAWFETASARQHSASDHGIWRIGAAA